MLYSESLSRLSIPFSPLRFGCCMCKPHPISKHHHSSNTPKVLTPKWELIKNDSPKTFINYYLYFFLLNILWHEILTKHALDFFSVSNPQTIVCSLKRPAPSHLYGCFNHFFSLSPIDPSFVHLLAIESIKPKSSNFYVVPYWPHNILSNCVVQASLFQFSGPDFLYLIFTIYKSTLYALSNCGHCWSISQTIQWKQHC